MTLGKISVVSGQIAYPRLTSKMPEIEYAQAKAHVWMHMLNERQNPKKWLKANSKGTKVNFDYIAFQEEYEKGLVDLECYLAEINVRFGLDCKLKKRGASEMAHNRTDSHTTDRGLGDKNRSDKPIRFKAKKNIYWEDWGHMKRVFVAGRVYDGILHSDGKVTAYCPYYDVSDYVDPDEIEII